MKQATHLIRISRFAKSELVRVASLAFKKGEKFNAAQFASQAIIEAASRKAK